MAKEPQEGDALPIILPLGAPTKLRVAGSHKQAKDEGRAKGKQKLARALREGEHDEE